eukprot:TRINITY_DN25218_c0_g1_i1.p1 TRINITY_DN25218_c0_g1~~TRINITY_DN25218_c0_g1_i1.p1  ORF type:complete len:580 (+),score=59.15 TRINITY_DN25218_c0_g1_i1:77-1816(+)
MKQYDFGNWGLAFVFSLEGSVFPKALAWALPNGLMAVGIWYLLNSDSIGAVSGLTDMSVGQCWVGYNWVLGFLLSFRTQRAYARWWEGGTLLQQARGEWFNAYSSCIAFSSADPSKKDEVLKFHNLLGRLLSILHGSALQQISTIEGVDFELLSMETVDQDALQYLMTKPEKCEVILQWIQRLIVINMTSGVLSIPPPVISRVFQELSRGIVNIHNVRKITEFQFPFPFAQMTSFMLVVHWALTPLAMALLVGSPIWAAVLASIPSFTFWGINYIASEIEQPFGEDPNDLPMQNMQRSMNASIITLLEERAQNPPDFFMPGDSDDEDIEHLVNQYSVTTAMGFKSVSRSDLNRRTNMAVFATNGRTKTNKEISRGTSLYSLFAGAAEDSPSSLRMTKRPSAFGDFSANSTTRSSASGTSRASSVNRNKLMRSADSVNVYAKPKSNLKKQGSDFEYASDDITSVEEHGGIPREFSSQSDLRNPSSSCRPNLPEIGSTPREAKPSLNEGRPQESVQVVELESRRGASSRPPDLPIDETGLDSEAIDADRSGRRAPGAMDAAQDSVEGGISLRDESRFGLTV